MLINKFNQYIGNTKKSFAGFYILTNLKKGDLNVGSSMNLYTRLKYSFKPISIDSGNRLINKNIKEYGIENLKLDIYIIKTESSVLPLNSSSIKTLILCLEQYYILNLNPSLNFF